MTEGRKYLRSSVYCTICAVWVEMRVGINGCEFVHPSFSSGEATHRNGLIKVSGSRNAIMVEEFGRGAQCAHAGFLSTVGPNAHCRAVSEIYFFFSTDPPEKEFFFLGGGTRTRKDLMVSTARMATSMVVGELNIGTGE